MNKNVAQANRTSLVRTLGVAKSAACSENMNIRTKIFNNNLNKNPKKVLLRSRLHLVGKVKYLPSYSKEWKNIVYSFNRNNLKNIPANDVNVNKIIQNYFDLFFKKKFKGVKRVKLLKRRKFLRRIFVSNVEIKHTNNKAKITLYTINREKEILQEKYMELSKEMNFKLFDSYIHFYNNHINNIYSFLCSTSTAQAPTIDININSSEASHSDADADANTNASAAINSSEASRTNNMKKEISLPEILKIRNEYFFAAAFINKKNYLNHKWNYLQIFLKLNNLLLRKTLSLLIKNQSKRYRHLLRRYNLLYSLNIFKFNKLVLLPKLSNLLSKIIGKKIEYNIINLKSISYHTDLFTKILALKLQKTQQGHDKGLLAVLKQADIPAVNAMDEKERIRAWENSDIYRNKYKDLKVISNLGEGSGLTTLAPKLKTVESLRSHKLSVLPQENISELLTTIYNDQPASTTSTSYAATENIHNLIYNSIDYKTIQGIKIEVKGRLTKRYRADRSVYSLKTKGGMHNISSYLGLSSVVFRGNTNSHVGYSLAKSKRRVGAFAVKGWIAASK